MFKHFIRNTLLLKNNEKLIICLNYHRIGSVDKNNPFHRLHTVNLNLFKFQILFLKLFGNFVSPAQIKDYANLSNINFCITFDDVSVTVLKIKSFLESRKIPYSIAPCIKITENGYGDRDKVYFVDHYIDKQTIYDFTANVLKDDFNEPFESFSFYKFTKNSNYDLKLVHELITEKLFNKIDNKFLKNFHERNYLSWNDLKTHFINNDLVTIINHSYSHNNFENSRFDDINHDLILSIKKFKEELNFTPNFYAVPFGQPTENLTYDLTYLLRENNYSGIFWVTGNSNMYKSKLNNQLLHINRIHVPTSVLYFFIAIFKSILYSNKAIIDSMKVNNTDSNSFVINKSNNESKYLSVENILREKKDYASSKSYFNYFFTQNIYKAKAYNYYTSINKNRIKVLGANFFLNFIFQTKLINGSIWSNWRNFSNSSNISSGVMLRSATKDFPILGAYKSSKYAINFYVGKYWRKIKVYNAKWDIKSNSTNDFYTCDSFDNDFIPLIKNFNKNIFFSVLRNDLFYKWRYDKYPLTFHKYVYLKSTKTPSCFCVVLYNNSIGSISDFVYDDIDDLSKLFKSVESFLKSKGVLKVMIESSRLEVINLIKNNTGINTNYFFNYYHFNNRKLNNIDLHNFNENSENSNIFHETRASGDVLLRNLDN